MANVRDLLFRQWHRQAERWNNRREPAELTLFATVGFWVTLSATIAGAACSAYLIYAHDPRTAGGLCYTGQCFENLVRIYKFPLGVVSVGLGLIALISYNHRSRQTARGMQLQLEQNTFTNYYKHVSEFEAHAEKHKVSEDASLRDIYRTLYPDANWQSANFQIDTELIETVKAYNKTISEFNSPLAKTADRANFVSKNDIHELLMPFKLQYAEEIVMFIETAQTITKICRPSMDLMGRPIIEAIAISQTCAEDLKKLCQFDHSSQANELYMAFTKIEHSLGCAGMLLTQLGGSFNGLAFNWKNDACANLSDGEAGLPNSSDL